MHRECRGHCVWGVAIDSSELFFTETARMSLIRPRASRGPLRGARGGEVAARSRSSAGRWRGGANDHAGRLAEPWIVRSGAASEAPSALGLWYQIDLTLPWRLWCMVLN